MTLMERAVKTQEKYQKHKKLYDAKMAIPVTCPYCKATSNVWLITKHMRVSKKCNALKELFLLTSENPNMTEAKILLQLNDFKRGIYEAEPSNSPSV